MDTSPGKVDGAPAVFGRTARLGLIILNSELVRLAGILVRRRASPMCGKEVTGEIVDGAIPMDRLTIPEPEAPWVVG